jgi:protein arginine phosphatase
MMVRILFVCTGNTCRSPMAEAILKNKAVDGLEVKSAGVFAVNGSQASSHAKTVLQENNIPEDHQSTMLTAAEINWASHIFTMTEGHKWSVVGQYPAAADKTFTIKEFAGILNNPDIVDPYGGSVEHYRETFKELSNVIEKIIQRLEEEI